MAQWLSSPSKYATAKNVLCFYTTNNLFHPQNLALLSQSTSLIFFQKKFRKTSEHAHGVDRVVELRNWFCGFDAQRGHLL